MSASLSASPLSFFAARAAHQSHEPRQSSPMDGVDSNDLLQGQKTVAIHHNGSIYRLQATRLGKLILTK